MFDLGYYDYGWWAEVDAAGCRIVTRFKSNTPLTVETERLIEPGALAIASATVLSDRTGDLPARQTSNRHNPMQRLVREVAVRPRRRSPAAARSPTGGLPVVMKSNRTGLGLARP